MRDLAFAVAGIMAGFALGLLIIAASAGDETAPDVVHAPNSDWSNVDWFCYTMTHVETWGQATTTDHGGIRVANGYTRRSGHCEPSLAKCEAATDHLPRIEMILDDTLRIYTLVSMCRPAPVVFCHRESTWPRCFPDAYLCTKDTPGGSDCTIRRAP